MLVDCLVRPPCAASAPPRRHRVHPLAVGTHEAQAQLRPDVILLGGKAVPAGRPVDILRNFVAVLQRLSHLEPGFLQADPGRIEPTLEKRSIIGVPKC